VADGDRTVDADSVQYLDLTRETSDGSDQGVF